MPAWTHFFSPTEARKVVNLQEYIKVQHVEYQIVAPQCHLPQNTRPNMKGLFHTIIP